MAVEIRAGEPGDEAADLRLMHQSFTYSPAQARRYTETRLDESRVAVEEGVLLAAMRFVRAGQWFRGHVVPTALVYGVKTAPEARGRGIGTLLAETVLRELRADGIALCTLDPSTVAAYRRQGFEIAATSVCYSVPVADLPRRGPMAVERWDDDVLDEITAFYDAVAAREDGFVDRSTAWWDERVLHDRDGAVYRYLVRGDDGIEGYIVHTQPPAVPTGPAGTLAFDVDVRDMLWVTPGAAASLLAYVASHRTIAERLRWTASRLEPLAMLLEWENVSVTKEVPWMSRIIDISAALTERRYADGVAEAVELAVADPLLAENSGAFQLEVAGGRGKFSERASAAASLDIGTLTALYTGSLSPVDAVRIGRLVGADESCVAALTRIFPQGAPWISDTF